MAAFAFARYSRSKTVSLSSYFGKAITKTADDQNLLRIIQAHTAIAPGCMFYLNLKCFPIIYIRQRYFPIECGMVPDLKEVKTFANHLHSLGKYWQGELFGWQAEYTPESDKKPEDLKMTFTPADFWIGVLM